MKSDAVSKNLIANSVGVGIACFTLHPLDLYRVRWQISNEKNMYLHLKNIIKTEGFWNGLYRPALFTNMTSAVIARGIGFGLYPFVYDGLITVNSKANTIFNMFFAGLVSGSLGYLVAYPLWKKRLIIHTSLEIKRNKDTFIDKSNRNGLAILITRGGLINAGHTLGYHLTKKLAKQYQIIPDGPALHFLASLVASTFSCLLSMPADNILTYKIGYGSSETQFNTIANRHGFRGFYRGFLSMYFRVTVFYVIYMTLYEQTRKLLGLSYF